MRIDRKISIPSLPLIGLSHKFVNICNKQTLIVKVLMLNNVRYKGSKKLILNTHCKVLLFHIKIRVTFLLVYFTLTFITHDFFSSFYIFFSFLSFVSTSQFVWTAEVMPTSRERRKIDKWRENKNIHQIQRTEEKIKIFIKWTKLTGEKGRDGNGKF